MGAAAVSRGLRARAAQWLAGAALAASSWAHAALVRGGAVSGLFRGLPGLPALWVPA